MEQKNDYMKKYKDFKLSENDFPAYAGAEQFGRSLKICNLQQKSDISYSNMTQITQKQSEK